MSVVSVAIIGRNDEPLYVREFGDEQSILAENDIFGLSSHLYSDNTSRRCSIRQQFILKEALERIEHLDVPGFFWRSATGTGTDGNCFVGLLFPVEDMRVYGYITATKIKVIAAMEDDVMTELAIEQQEKDAQINNFMSNVHNAYVEYLMNPFHSIEETKIDSAQFDKAIDNVAMSFNQEV